MSSAFGTIDWSAIGAVCGLIGVVALVSGAVATRVSRWSRAHRAEAGMDQRIITALFGREAVPPYGEVVGVVAAQATTAKAVATLASRVQTVESSLSSIESSMATLIARTETNGGTSMKDQLNRIEAELKRRPL